MFGLFESQEKKMRVNAANWLEIADKVYHFRRDLLAAPTLARLEGHRARLKALLKEKDSTMKLKLEIEALEPVLKEAGGAIYPKTSLVDNVEFFLVAALVILGIRTYFVQPFKIPTNSMWPTYYGMTPEVYTKPADEPGPVATAVRLVAFGAFPHRLDAPADGEVLIPIGGAESRGYIHCKKVGGVSWGVIPTDKYLYTLVVGEQPVTVKLPVDFDIAWAMSEAFFSDGNPYDAHKFYGELAARIERGQYVTALIDGQPLRCIRTGHFVRRGERVMSFDVLTGDQLFVDRFSYNFVKPSVGSGFVFRTDNIKSPNMQDRTTHQQMEQYYIKRLVGTPGDTLEVKGQQLWRNGAPITGAEAFEANAHRAGRYPGYVADGMLAPGEQVHVPEHSYYAMGDNSPNSEDSRFWGYVPYKDAIGRPLFIYFPFTGRWGRAH